MLNSGNAMEKSLIFILMFLSTTGCTVIQISQVPDEQFYISESYVGLTRYLIKRAYQEWVTPISWSNDPHDVSIPLYTENILVIEVNRGATDEPALPPFFAITVQNTRNGVNVYLKHFLEGYENPLPQYNMVKKWIKEFQNGQSKYDVGTGV